MATVPMEMYRDLAVQSPSKILLIVADGLAGLPHPQTGKTEMETARTPNLDALAQRSQQGVITMVGPGVTPGSGPGHLSLFGYDPIRYDIGRGALSALGVDFPLQPTDVAGRLNFCTLDADGNIVDRRAGRIPTTLNAELCAKINASVRLDGAGFFLQPEEEYRGVFVLRGEGLSDQLTDTDPQITGVAPYPVEAKVPEAQHAAGLVNDFIRKTREVIAEETPANGVLMRGFAHSPDLPQFTDLYKLNPCAIAVYPMYKGLARLVGMKVIGGLHQLEEELDALRDRWNDHDFFFFHIKYTDSAGEDGDFDRKVSVIERIDGVIPQMLELNPDVLALTGDHSTPSIMRGHSWHPVPFLLHSPWCIPDEFDRFNERTARRGSLGHMAATEGMGLLMAHSLKLLKYGA